MTFEPLTAERRRQQTREVLLAAAAQVFAERGFHGASLDQVAAAAGFTKGAVYSNFKNKDDLFLALIEAAYSREMAALRETLEASEVPAAERLGDFVSIVRDELDRGPQDWNALYLEFSLYAMRNPAARARLNELEADDIRGVAEIIERGRQQGTAGLVALGSAEDEVVPSESALHAARLITALFRGLGLMRSLNPEAVGAELLEEAMSFVTRGLGVATDEGEVVSSSSSSS
jgi:AcrR family transcriptional regulator